MVSMCNVNEKMIKMSLKFSMLTHFSGFCDSFISVIQHEPPGGTKGKQVFGKYHIRHCYIMILIIII